MKDDDTVMAYWPTHGILSGWTRSPHHTTLSIEDENGDISRMCWWADNQNKKTQRLRRVPRVRKGGVSYGYVTIT